MISRHFTVKNIVFIIMAALFIIFIAKITDIALMFFASFVISCTLIPIIDKMQKRMPRVLAVTIVLFLLILGIMLVFIPLTIFTLKQGYVLFKNLPNYIQHLQSVLDFKVMGYSPAVLLSPDALSGYAQKMSDELLTLTINFTKGLAGSATGAIAMTIMIFYICQDTKQMRNGFLNLFPPRFKKKTEEILDAIMVKVGGYVFAQLLAMIFVGVLTAIGLLLIGNEHALSLGFITFVLDIVPVIGPALAVGLGLFISANHGFGYVMLVFVIYMLAQGLQNQLLRPLVFGKFMDMHPLIIIISLLIGAKFLGVWGVILAPAIASVVCVLIDELYIKTINKG